MDGGLRGLCEEPVFVVGAVRSGTTWVHEILTAHPEVAGVSESLLFSPGSGLGVLFAPVHWGDVPYGLGRVLSRSELVCEVRDLASRVLARAVGPEHRFLVEKTPRHGLVMEHIAEVFPRARFIHVLRDGRDVVTSVRAAVSSWAPQWRDASGRSITTSAREWRLLVTETRRQAKGLGGRFLEVRYEALRRDPFGSYRQLFDFCRIPYDDSLLRQVFEATDFDRNYLPDETKFRRGGRIGDWRTDFSLLDAIAFDRAAGATLVETGYERDRRWPLRPRRRPDAGSYARQPAPAAHLPIAPASGGGRPPG